MLAIDNKKRVSTIKSIFAFSVIMYFITLILMFSFDILETKILLLFATVFLFIKFILIHLMNVNRVIFIPENGKFILRYYPLRFKNVNHTSIELNKTEFSHFSIVTKYFGLLTYIVLYKDTINGLAKYPPVNITFLSKNETVNLLLSLKNYMVQK